MPRYRFRWEYLDEELLATLLPAPELDHSQRASALRAQVGARPSADLVGERWPELRDRWMPRVPEIRGRVVRELRARRLGDTTIDTSSESGQLAYLNSCRNSSTLRAVVLGELIRAGEPPPPGHTPPRVARTWPEFAAALATVLSRMTEGQYLVLVVKGTGVELGADGTAGSAYFVQFAAGGDAGMRAEAVSNRFLEGSERLDDARAKRALELGWLPPTAVPAGSGDGPGSGPADGEAEAPNYFREWPPPVPFADVAELATRTFAEVYRVAHPGFLHCEAFGADGSPLPVDGLGLASRPGGADRPDAEPAWTRPESADELRAAAQATLRELLDDPTLQPDSDGDLGFSVGSAVIFVRAMPEAPVLRLFSYILTDVRWSPTLLGALNDLNRDHLFVSAFFDDDCVILRADLFASPYTPEHLVGALRAFAAIADEYDDVLLARFGGRVASGATARPHDTDRAGYL